jgi:hypothetical protein
MVRCRCNKLTHRCLSVVHSVGVLISSVLYFDLSLSVTWPLVVHSSSITHHHAQRRRFPASRHILIHTCPTRGSKAIRTSPCPRHHMDGRPESRHGQPNQVCRHRDLDTHGRERSVSYSAARLSPNLNGKSKIRKLKRDSPQAKYENLRSDVLTENAKWIRIHMHEIYRSIRNHNIC